MTEPAYALENEKYAFYMDGVRRFETEEVAILFDRDTGGMLAHGLPEVVNARHAILRQALIAAGLPQDADQLVCFAGKFDVEDLNKVVSICDYAGRFYKKLLEQVAAKEHAHA